jgi:hypothetical protein
VRNRYKDATLAANRWQSVYEEEVRSRIQKIERERDSEIAALDPPYQQRVAEITAEYERALADIEMR